jgi:hypothetical protein
MSAADASRNALKILLECYLSEHSLFRTYDYMLGDTLSYSYERKQHASGTTATEVPDARGRYSSPVYFDWHAEWPRVRRLFETAETQRLLNVAITHARGLLCYEMLQTNGELSLTDVNSEIKPYELQRKWPYFHLGYDRNGEGEQDKMVCELLTDTHCAEVDQMVAAALPRLLEACLVTFADEGIYGLDEFDREGELTEAWQEEGFDYQHATETELRAFLATQLKEDVTLASELSDKFWQLELPSWQAASDSWLRAAFDDPLLLLGTGRVLFSQAPYLGYQIAWELAPPDAELRLVFRDDDEDDEERHCAHGQGLESIMRCLIRIAHGSHGPRWQLA